MPPLWAFALLLAISQYNLNYAIFGSLTLLCWIYVDDFNKHRVERKIPLPELELAQDSPKHVVENDDLHKAIQEFVQYFLQPAVASARESEAFGAIIEGRLTHISTQIDEYLYKLTMDILQNEQENLREFMRRLTFCVFRALHRRCKADKGEVDVLHSALDNPQSHVRSFVESVWSRLLESQKMSRYIASNRLVKYLIREALVNRMICPMMEHVCDPNWINQTIDRIAKRKLQEQHLAELFYQVVVDGFTSFPQNEFTTETAWQTRQVAGMNKRIRHCDALFKHVKRCRTIADAKNVRYALTVEIERTEKSMNANPERRDMLERHLKTLVVTKQKYEKRISVLQFGEQASQHGLSIEKEDATFHTNARGGKKMKARMPQKIFTTSLEPNTTGASISARDSQDLNSLLMDYHRKKSEDLFYFLQYMEKSGLEKKVQFWLEAENVRDVLSSQRDRIKFMKAETERLFQSFLNSVPILEVVHPSTLFAIKRFVQVDSDSDYEAIFQAQAEVYRNMEVVDYPEFTKSESYIRWRSDMERVTMNSPISDDAERDNVSSIYEADTVSLSSNNQNIVNVSEGNSRDDFDKSDILMSLRRSLKRILSKHSTSDSLNQLHNFSSSPNLASSLPASAIHRRNLSSGNLASSFANSPVFDWRTNDDSEQPIIFVHDNSILEEVLMRVSWEDRLDTIMLQIQLVEHLMKQAKQQAQRNSELNLSVLRRTRELLRRDLGDLVENKMSNDISGKYTDQLKWSVFISPSGTKSKDSVYFLDVTVEDQRGWARNWIVPRRFDEFNSLHNRLKDQFPVVSDFSGRLFHRIQWNRIKLDSERNKQLSVYLQLLVEHQEVSKSEALRKFLSDDSPFNNKQQTLSRKRGEKLADKALLLKLLDQQQHQEHAKTFSDNSALSMLLAPSTTTVSTPRAFSFSSSVLLDRPKALSVSSQPLGISSEDEDMSYSNQSNDDFTDAEDTRLASSLSIPRQTSSSSIPRFPRRHPLIHQQVSSIESKDVPRKDSTEPANFVWTSLSQPVLGIMLELFRFQEKNLLLKESAALLLLKQGVFGKTGNSRSVDRHMDDLVFSLLDTRFVVKGLSYVEQLAQEADENIIKSRMHKLKSELIQEIQTSFQPQTSSSKAQESPSKKPIWQQSHLTVSINSPPSPSVEQIESNQLRREAHNSLLQLIPLSFKRILGEDEAFLGFTKIFDLFQNFEANKSLMFYLMDEIKREFGLN